MRDFTPSDWYWRADDGRIFSSSRSAMVLADDVALGSWRQDGQPTVWPRDASGAQTDDALKDVLNPYGIWLDAPVLAPVITYKADLFRRATDAEADQIDAALHGTSTRMRNLFNAAQFLDHTAEEFLVLQAAAIDLFGQARADALLAPSV